MLISSLDDSIFFVSISILRFFPKSRSTQQQCCCDIVVRLEKPKGTIKADELVSNSKQGELFSGN
jgi:hypothetical protein